MPEEATTSRAGWARVSLGDVVRKVSDKVDPRESGLERYVAGEHLNTDDLRIRNWGLIGDGYLGPAFHMRFKPGHVLYGSRRTYLRKVALADFEGVTANTTYVLESRDPSVLMSELVPFIMQTEAFHAHSIARSKGSVNPYVNFSDIASFQFLLPPIQEQARLAEVLAAHRAACEGFRELEDRLANVKAAFIEECLTRNLADAPSLAVAELLIEGPRNGKSPPAAEGDGGFRSVSVSAVSNGHFEPAGCIKFVDIDPADARPFLVRAGDAFAVRGNGNRRLMGKAGLSTESHDDLIFPDLLIRLRFDSTVILREFAVAQWNHPSVHVRLAARAKSSNGIWKINGQDIRAHTLLVPTIREQRKVVPALDEFDSQIASAQDRQRQLHRLQEKLQERAFLDSAPL